MPTKSEIESHFDSLVSSAFDFVERAISSFDENERISLFLFATGLELFTKARLYDEHWSLIFANVDQAEFRRFASGDLKTVAAEKAHERIRQIIGHTLPASFGIVRQHRNRIAHFTHGTTAEQRLEIVSHQVRGWYDLYHLLRNEWQPTFKKYRKRYSDLERKMRTHRAFLDAKFQAIQPDLEVLRTRGKSVLTCPACGFDAMQAILLSGSINLGDCQICRRVETYVSEPCMNEDCAHPIAFLASQGAPESCPKCEESYSGNLKEVLDTDPITTDDYHSRSPINCPDCMGNDSVVTHHAGYVCTACFSYDDEVSYCGWCTEGQLGELGEFSELSGCEFCDGRAGWDKD